MTKILIRTVIVAPIELVFELSTSIELHLKSTFKTNEQAIAGKTSGLLGYGETVTWRAKHFGIYQNFTSKITQYDRPHSFTDEMQQGAFKSFRHVHSFSEENGSTIMTDFIDFKTPLGFIGKFVNRFIMKSYLTRFIQERNALIKTEAESIANEGNNLNLV